MNTPYANLRIVLSEGEADKWLDPTINIIGVTGEIDTGS